MATDRSKKEKIGLCNICGKYSKLTFDHIPPKACENKTKTQIFDLLPANLEKKQGEFIISQNGFKKKTICSDCNNTLLGTNLDVELASFCEKIRCKLEDNYKPRHISLRFNGQKILLPNKVNIKCKINKVIKAVLCRILAAKDNFDNVVKIDINLRDFILKNNLKAVSQYSLFFRIYPYNSIVLARDFVVGIAHNPQIILPKGLLSGLYFYPLAFILADKDKKCGMINLINYLQTDDNMEVEVVVDLNSWLFRNMEIIPPAYPFSPDDKYSGMALMGQNSNTFFALRDLSNNIKNNNYSI